jgi:hypothetical protein
MLIYLDYHSTKKGLAEIIFLQVDRQEKLDLTSFKSFDRPTPYQ